MCVFCEGNKDDTANEMFLTGHCVCVFCEGNKDDMANEMFLTGHCVCVCSVKETMIWPMKCPNRSLCVCVL